MTSTVAGAMLAWERWHPQQPIPELINYLHDRDLQRLQLPDSQAVHYALLSYPINFAVWDTLTIDQLKAEGRIIARFANQMIAKISSHAAKREVCRYSNIPTVNTSVLIKLGTEQVSELLRELEQIVYDAIDFIFWLKS